MCEDVRFEREGVDELERSETREGEVKGELA